MLYSMLYVDPFEKEWEEMRVTTTVDRRLRYDEERRDRKGEKKSMHLSCFRIIAMDGTM